MAMTLKEYLSPIEVDKRLLSGRTPLVGVSIELEREWYEEQTYYVMNGRRVGKVYFNPFMYHFMNFHLFEIPMVIGGKISHNSFHIGNPIYSRVDQYIMDTLWEAAVGGEIYALMGSRGIGKTHYFVSVMNRRFNFFPGSVNFISSSMPSHADASWTYMDISMREFYKKYPGFAHKLINDSDVLKYSGEIKMGEYGAIESGYLSIMKKQVYGKNSDKIRSTRPHTQLIEEFGAFPDGKNLGNLKDVFTQSRGAWAVGGSNKNKCLVMMAGTGGSVRNDYAKDIFFNPRAFNIYAVNEWDGMDSGIFIPVQYKKMGTWEATGVPNVEVALTENNVDRLVKMSDTQSYMNFIQEYPQNLREVFLKKGTNRFNPENLAEAWNRIELGLTRPVIRGSLLWKRNGNGDISGVEFERNRIGNIYIVEEPELSPSGAMYEDLYIAGIDSIDVGDLDSVTHDGSKLSVLIKKRVIDGKFFSSSSNLYVAYYNYRSGDVRDDYENALKLCLYYGAKVNLEWTKIKIVEYFRQYGYYHLFLERAGLLLSDKSGKKKSKYMGTPGSTQAQVHMDEKVREYVSDNYLDLDIMPLVEQLRDFNENDRRRFDMVISMGLCEISDAEYMGIGAREQGEVLTSGFKPMRYYVDERGNKQYGYRQASAGEQLIKGMLASQNSGIVRWVDEKGVNRFDEDYYESRGGEKSEENDKIDFKMY